MAGGESKVARLQETSAKKSRKCKPPKTSSGLFEARVPEPSEEVQPKPKVPDEVQDSPVPSQGDLAPNSAEGESSHAPRGSSARGNAARYQCPHVKLFGKDDGLGGDIDSPPKA